MRGTRRSRKPQIVDLHRRRTLRKHGRSISLGVSAQIYRNVDFHGPHHPGDLVVALVSHVHEPVDCLFKARPDFTLILGSERQAIHLEFRPVVNLEQTRDRERHRMFAEIS